MNYFIFLPEAKISICAVTKNTDSVELHCQLGSQNCLQVEKNYESIPPPPGDGRIFIQIYSSFHSCAP